MTDKTGFFVDSHIVKKTTNENDLSQVFSIRW